MYLNILSTWCMIAAIQTDDFIQHFQVAEYLTGRSGSSAEQFRRKELLLAAK